MSGLPLLYEVVTPLQSLKSIYWFAELLFESELCKNVVQSGFFISLNGEHSKDLTKPDIRFHELHILG